MIYIFLTHIPKFFFGQSTPLYMCASMRNSYSSVRYARCVCTQYKVPNPHSNSWFFKIKKCHTCQIGAKVVKLYVLNDRK